MGYIYIFIRRPGFPYIGATDVEPPMPIPAIARPAYIRVIAPWDQVCIAEPAIYIAALTASPTLGPNISATGIIASAPRSVPRYIDETMFEAILLKPSVPGGGRLNEAWKDGRARHPPMTPEVYPK